MRCGHFLDLHSTHTYPYFMFMGDDERTDLHTILDVVDIGRGPHTRCA